MPCSCEISLAADVRHAHWLTAAGIVGDGHHHERDVLGPISRMAARASRSMLPLKGGG